MVKEPQETEEIVSGGSTQTGSAYKAWSAAVFVSFHSQCEMIDFGNLWKVIFLNQSFHNFGIFGIFIHDCFFEFILVFPHLPGEGC